jgi:hypothetical protein
MRTTRFAHTGCPTVRAWRPRQRERLELLAQHPAPTATGSGCLLVEVAAQPRVYSHAKHDERQGAWRQ